MNGEQEMVNKYHKKSVEVFNENLRDEMRGLPGLRMTLWKYLINFWQIN